METFIILNITGKGKTLFLGYGDIWVANRIDAQPYNYADAKEKVAGLLRKNLPMYTSKNVYFTRNA